MNKPAEHKPKQKNMHERKQTNINKTGMLQIPIGLESNAIGLVDLLKKKAFYFHGDNG